MSNIQAVIEFSIELNKFINIDLFQRGFYQIRVSHKILSKVVNKIEVTFGECLSLPEISDINKSGNAEFIVFPQCIINGIAVSKTFHIIYKNQEVLLQDVIKFKTYLLINVNNCSNFINETIYALDFELWFTDQEFAPSSHNLIECVASRQLILHFDVFKGLHYFLPILFDYFHLSAITIAIHASLISLCQPFSSKGKGKLNFKEVSSDSCNQGYEMLFFGCSYSDLNTRIGCDGQTMIRIRLRRAQLIHWQLCSLLIIAIQSLKKKLNEYLNLLPPWTQFELRTNDLNLAIEKLSPLAQKCYQICLETNQNPACFNFVAYQNGSFPSSLNSNKSVISQPKEYLTSIQSDIAYLCGFAIFQWQAFLKVVLHNEKVNQYLSKVHHLHRIKRFSEAFFTIEKSRKWIFSFCDSFNTFSEISDILRKSSYLSKLPRCDVECTALDGDMTTLPIIYEENYKQSNENCFNDLTCQENCRRFLSEVSSRKNLKERFLKNLNRFNFGRIKSSEEHSPISSRLLSLPIKLSNQAYLPLLIKNNPSAFELRNTVTLLDFKKYDEEDNFEKDKHLPAFSNKTKKNKIKESESLPNLSFKTGSLNRTKFKQLENDLSLLKISEDFILSFKKKKCSLDQNEAGSECIETNYDNLKKVELSLKQNENSKCDSDLSKPFDVAIDNKKKDDLIEDSKCTILDMFKNNQCLLCAKDECDCPESADFKELPSFKRLSTITSDVISFVTSKEEFREQAGLKERGWNIYSDFSNLASRVPYFQCDSEFKTFNVDRLHLIICVHGLDGTCSDLRLVKTYLELGLPATNFDFLMSQKNQGDTFTSFEVLTSRLVEEITYHIQAYSLNPKRISFIGHSLGNIIIRAAICRPELKQWRSKFHTFLSLSGPHLGTLYNNNGLVNMGLWFMQKWKKSESLLQLTMKDSSEVKQTYLYKLSRESGLEYFQNVLLCGSSQDHYVPIHSAHIELCNSALSDLSVNGEVYREMVTNLLQPLVSNNSTKLVRYDFHLLSSSAQSIFGRTAHIAFVDSELFIEKFMVVVGLKYFE